MNNEKALELLRRTRVEVAPETFNLVSLRREDWLKLLENPELSPRMSAPFMILSDNREVTLLLDEIDFGTIRHAVREAKTEGEFSAFVIRCRTGFQRRRIFRRNFADFSCR